MNKEAGFGLPMPKWEYEALPGGNLIQIPHHVSIAKLCVNEAFGNYVITAGIEIGLACQHDGKDIFTAQLEFYRAKKGHDSIARVGLTHQSSLFQEVLGWIEMVGKRGKIAIGIWREPNPKQQTQIENIANFLANQTRQRCETAIYASAAKKNRAIIAFNQTPRW